MKLLEDLKRWAKRNNVSQDFERTEWFYVVVAPTRQSRRSLRRLCKKHRVELERLSDGGVVAVDMISNLRGGDGFSLTVPLWPNELAQLTDEIPF